jgi:hypothetical protein
MPEQTENHSNLFYFESSSMRELHECLENWQKTSRNRIRSLSIKKDRDCFCAIVLVDSRNSEYVEVSPYDREMAKFQRKALKHIGVGINFSTNEIPPNKIMTIQTKLKECKTADEVRKVFLEEYRIISINRGNFSHWSRTSPN